jgi:protein SCO1/2
VLRCFAAAAAFLLAPPLPAAEPLKLDDALRASQAAIGRPLGDYALTAADGRRVRLSEFRGKPLLVNFVYTGCTQVCPTTTTFLARALQEAQAALGADAFSTVTIGFNPPADSPQAMRTFARTHGLDLPHWAFLSPDSADVAALTRDFGFVYAPTAAGFDHLTQLTIVDANGRVFRQIYGDTFALPMLVGPLKELATGAPAPVQNLAALIERVRILCTVYDPLSGRYRLNYALFIEIFAGLSILGSVAWFLTSEWRRQRRAA